MSVYLKKQIEDENGAVAEAWRGKELVANLDTGRAHVVEAGYKNGQYIADGKRECVIPILWTEPDITALITTKDYPAGTSVFDIVFEVIAGRMLTMDNIPGTTTPNPLKDAVITEVPTPTSED